MKVLLLIAIGGGLGSMLRHWLSTCIYQVSGPLFPCGTLTINIIGSFFIGLLTALLLEKISLYSMEIRAFLLIGCLGGFTTFSTFAIEALSLFENGESFRAFFYITASVVLSLFAAFSGSMLGRQL